MSSQELLAMLKEAGDRWLSGEAISQRLGVSRTAIWKQIESLRAMGYQVEAAPRKGYRLQGRPDSVTPDEVLPGLTTRLFGRRVEYQESVGSTNEVAKQLARAGAPEGLLVIADEQTAGKGRLGRGWSTPRGSAIAMSLILRPALPPYHAPRITLAAAVAVCEAVRELTGLPAGIKWPNDLQIAGRKFCGILTEMEAEMDRVAFVVLGIGLNVHLKREEMDPALRESATSLAMAGATGLRRAALVQAVMARLEPVYDDLTADRFERVLHRWRALSVTLGARVRAHSVDGAPVAEGVAEDVDADGALIIRLQDGSRRRVVAGEVTMGAQPPSSV